MRVLVTGAAGLLGTALCHVLSQDHDVLGLDLPELDLVDKTSVRRALNQYAPQAVVQCAAYTNVDQAERHRQMAFRVNADGAGNVAKACAERSIYLIQISTDYVFDGHSTRPYEPNDIPSPINAYGESKLAGERAVQEACPSALIVRTCGLYEMHGRNFVTTILTRAFAGESLRIITDQTVGAPTYAMDLASALASFLVERPSGIVHVVNSGICTWHDFGRDVLSAAGLADYPIEPITSEQLGALAKRPSFSALGFGGRPPLRHFKEALHDFVPKYLAVLRVRV